MKNQWVADSADFGKYGLLRALCHPDPEDEYQPLRLGVVWYLTPDGDGDDKAPDSKSCGYLNPNDPDALLYSDCDPALYDKLAEVARSEHPTVGDVEAAGILPGGTVFFGGVVPEAQGKGSDEARRDWASDAAKATAGCDLVFVDPDNGLEPPPSPRVRRRNTKSRHARIDELKPYAERGQSLIIYQHLAMNGHLAHQLHKKKAEIERACLGSAFGMAYGRYKNGWVVFFVVPAEHHQGRLNFRARGMLGKPWGKHFLMVGGH